jgi:hypothetical protein
MIEKAIKQLRDNGYKPTAIWLSLDCDTFCVVTDNIDRSEYMKLLKKIDQ